MKETILEKLRPITAEEQRFLNGTREVQRELYTSSTGFVIDARHLLETGKLIDIRPATRFAHFPRHRHNYVELVYQCTGSTTHILNDDQTIVLKEGELLFLNQTVIHENLPAEEGDIAVNFIILPEFFSRVMSQLEEENVLRDFLISVLSGETSRSSYLYIQAGEVLPVQNLIENMVWTLIQGKHGMNLINQNSMALLFQNLSLFADSISVTSTRSSEQNLLFYVLRYIDLHYKDGTLAEVCSIVGEPTYMVSRLLKKHTGSNFKALLQQRKLQQAAYWLTNTPLSIDTIIESVGYDNSSYFYRRFKERYGMSPKEYRGNS